MEPFITSVVAALAAGAVAAAKDTASQVIKDTYASVRHYISSHYAKVELTGLEQEPDSKGQRLVVEEKLAKEDLAQDSNLPKLIADLLEALKNQAPDAAKTAGVDLDTISAAVDVQIRRVGAGGAVKIKGVTAGTGSVVIEDVGYTPKN